MTKLRANMATMGGMACALALAIGLVFAVQITGPSPMVLNLLKAMNTGVAATAFVVLLMYTPALYRGLRPHPDPLTGIIPPRSRAWFLISGICLTWLGGMMNYGWLAWLYWSTHIEPITKSPSPIGLRIAWLIFLMTGGAIHIAAAQRERLGVLPGFLTWSIPMAVFVAIVTFIGV